MPWDRPHFEPGGGDARLHYVVPGASASDLRVSRSRHRLVGVPPELELVSCAAADAGLPSLAADPAFGAALREALGPAADGVARARSATVVRGVLPDPASLGYLRDTLGILAALLDAGGLAVLDPLALRAWSPEGFRSDVHARDDVDAFQHVSVLRSDAHDGTWLHTRGLVKFGRPDLSVPSVQDAWYPAAVEMVERLAWAEVRGHVIPDGQAIRMAGLPEGLVCRHGGAPDDPDFGNVHVRIAPA